MFEAKSPKKESAPNQSEPPGASEIKRGKVDDEMTPCKMIATTLHKYFGNYSNLGHLRFLSRFLIKFEFFKFLIF